MGQTLFRHRFLDCSVYSITFFVVPRTLDMILHSVQKCRSDASRRNKLTTDNRISHLEKNRLLSTIQNA